METLTGNLTEDRKLIDRLLGVGKNFDVINRDLVIGGRQGRLYVIDGYGDDGVIERMTAFLLGEGASLAGKAQSMQELMETCITFCEVNCERDTDKILTGAFLGKTVLLLDGFADCILIDAKQFPGRSVEEPADGKVLRGSHDGFTETLVQNTALLRRRIRDTRLRLENHQLKNRSRTDVVIAYLDGKADEKLLDELRQKISRISVGSISMGQESVAEAMMPRQWYNPFPKVRYTERPDAATATIMEGNIVLLVDNSPAVMLLPTCFFDFLEEANDYYFPPLVGTYLRWIRIAVMVLALFITPAWYLIARDPTRLPDTLSFIAPEEPGSVPLLVQLLLVEFVVDLLKRLNVTVSDVSGLGKEGPYAVEELSCSVNTGVAPGL